MHVTIGLEDLTYPLYRIVNLSPVTLRFQQERPEHDYEKDVFGSSKWPWTHLPAGQTCAFAWDEVTAARPFHIAVVVASKLAFLALDSLHDAKQFDAGGQRFHLRVDHDGPTKVLVVQCTELGFSLHRHQSHREQLGWQFDVTVPRIGVSLIDDRPQEMLFATLEYVAVSGSVSNVFVKWSVALGRLQVDNHVSPRHGGPVVIHTAPFQPTGGQWAWLTMRVVQARNNKLLHYYKYFALLVQETTLCLDEALLRHLADVYDKLLVVWSPVGTSLRRQYLLDVLALASLDPNAPPAPEVVQHGLGARGGLLLGTARPVANAALGGGGGGGGGGGSLLAASGAAC